MFQRSSNHLMTGVACGVLGGAIVATGLGVAQATPQDQRQPHANNGDAVKVGTYEPQKAFNQYHGLEQYTQRTQALQLRGQEAQQQGDQQAVVAIQQELQSLQQQFLDRFYKEIEEAVPKVADNEGVQVVATDIIYTADEIEEPVDMTDELMDEVNKAAKKTPAPPTPPNGPGGIPR